MGLLLSKALRLESPTTIAFTGSGGKTTAIFQTARELLRRNRVAGKHPSRNKDSVIVTTSTHLGVAQVSLADTHLSLADDQMFDDTFPIQPGVLLITGPVKDDKTSGLDEKKINRLHHYCRAQGIFLLIEADGSRQRPIKAPAEHEPAIPGVSEMVVVITGLSGLDKSLNETVAHRPEFFSQLAGIRLDERITVDVLARFLTHPEGGIKNIPTTSRRAIILNQADTPALIVAAQKMVEPLLREFSTVVIAALSPEPSQTPNIKHVERKPLPRIHSVHERIAGIILAAGESKRFGKPKQLLLWRDQPFIRAVSQTALSAQLDPVIVVVGAQAELVTGAIDDLPVRIIVNREWSQGQSSSIRAGIRALEGTPATQNMIESYPARTNLVGGAVFLLADQPQIPVSVINGLIDVHAKELGSIIAPMVQEERRANPVLFDRDTFPALLRLTGDVGGRSLFSDYPVTYLPWQDKNLLADVDQPEDYEKLISGDQP